MARTYGRTAPGKEPLVLFGHEAGWAPEPVWTLWSKEKYFGPSGNGTSAVQLVGCGCTDWAIPRTILTIKMIGVATL
jgi:hypothetical protein